jgi:hypothetical protein
MEAFYKDRQKTINTYKKQIKKLSKQGRKEELTQMKQDYVQFLLTPFQRELFQQEEEYLKEMKKTVREQENRFIELKLDLCYDLHQGLKEYDSYENTLNQIKKQQEKVLSAKKQRELAIEKNKKEIDNQYRGLLDSYPYLELEDKKVAYKELETYYRQIANPTRKVVAYEMENKETEYRLSQLYTPWTDIKIST